MRSFPAGATTALDRQGAEALYQQIARTFANEIRSGRLAANAQLPPEPQIGARFGVSRITVRLAVDELVKDGLVVRRHGKGTFVAPSVVRHDLHDLHGLFESLFAQGHAPAARLLAFEPNLPPTAVAEALRLAPGVAAARLERLYTVDEGPVALVSGWYAPDFLAATREEVESRSTAAVLRGLGLTIARADLTIRSERAGRAAGARLAIPAGAPVMVLARRSFLADERAVEVGRIVVRSEAYEFKLSTQDAAGVRPRLQSIAPRDGSIRRMP